LSDAVCGAIFNAVTHTPKPVNEEVEVLTYSQLRAMMRAEAEVEKDIPERPGEVINPPRREKPEWLQDYLARATLL